MMIIIVIMVMMLIVLFDDSDALYLLLLSPYPPVFLSDTTGAAAQAGVSGVRCSPGLSDRVCGPLPGGGDAAADTAVPVLLPTTHQIQSGQMDG